MSIPRPRLPAPNKPESKGPPLWPRKQKPNPAILDLSDPATVERLAAALEAMKHALAAVNEALDKNSYGDMVESALLEAHATLDSAILAALAEGER